MKWKVGDPTLERDWIRRDYTAVNRQSATDRSAVGILSDMVLMAGNYWKGFVNHKKNQVMIKGIFDWWMKEINEKNSKLQSKWMEEANEIYKLKATKLQSKKGKEVEEEIKSALKSAPGAINEILEGVTGELKENEEWKNNLRNTIGASKKLGEAMVKVVKDGSSQISFKNSKKSEKFR